MNAMQPTDGDFAVNSGEPMADLMPPAPMEHPVPLEALRQPNDQEELVQPEVGDEVSYTVTGTVARIEGDRVVVTPTSVNGQEVAEASAPEPETNLAALEAEAKGMSV
jgi:hypothetical protein